MHIDADTGHVHLGAATGDLKELSGLALLDDDAYATHNDSGDRARFWRIAPDGVRTEWTVRLKSGPATARDWEDIAVGLDPITRRRRLWLFDTGGPTAHPAIYIVDQPADRAPADARGHVAIADRYPFVYQAGRAVDVEAAFVTPSGSAYFVCKRTGTVYRLRIEATDRTALAVARLAITKATAADMTADGNRLVVRNYDGTWLWNRRLGEQTTAMLTRPADGYLTDKAGAESIALDRDGNGWTTVCEGVGSRFRHWTLTP